MFCFMLFFFKQKTAYEMRISDWSSDVCSSDLLRRVPARSSGGRLLLLVNGLAQLHGDLRQFLRLRLHRLGIAALDRRPGGGDGGFDLRLEASVHLVAMLAKLLLGGVDQAFGIVLRLGRLALLLVLFRSAEGRVGNIFVSKGRYWWSPLL